MTQSDFDFLKHGKYNGLYHLIVSAEQYAYSDPIVSLFRARQFIEFLVFRWLAPDQSRSFGGSHGIRCLNATIDKLQRGGEITSAEYHALKEVNERGNDAVHRNYGGDNSDLALYSLRHCYLLAVRLLWPRGAGDPPSPSLYRQPLPPPPAAIPDRVSSRRAWIIRPYPHYQDCTDVFRRQNIIAIGWHLLGQLSGASSDQLLQRLRARFPDNSTRWERDLETIWLFLREMQEKDLVVMAPYDSGVDVGQVKGPYRFRKSESATRAVYSQQREVVWFDTNVPRKDLPVTVRRNIRKLTLVETNATDLLFFCREMKYKLMPG